ncbi:MAG: type II secretion system protein [Candidatus Gracilibacteria bacterium]
MDISISDKNKGFTLIELLVVVAIISLLAVVFIPKILNAPSKARDVQRMVDVKKIVEFIINSGKTYNSSGSIHLIHPAEGSALGILSYDIKNDLGYFGGRFPLDPLKSTCFVQMSGMCPRSDDRNAVYAYIKYTNSNNPADFGVFAKVENLENGNIAKFGSDTGGSNVWGSWGSATKVKIVKGGEYYGVFANK